MPIGDWTPPPGWTWSDAHGWSPPAPSATLDEVQRWRDDAFEAAAVIVERHLGKEAAIYIAEDIRALKSAPR